MIQVRGYQADDYSQLVILYRQSELYGGQFDEDKDSAERLNNLIRHDPLAILVAENDGRVIGTVSLQKDERAAWLFRFAVQQNEHESEVLEKLETYARSVLESQGHHQVLVYAPANDDRFEQRYRKLGFQKGGDFTCYWKSFTP